MEVRILHNKGANRLILVDNDTRMAFVSVGKEDKIYKYLMEYKQDEITIHKRLKTKPCQTKK